MSHLVGKPTMWFSNRSDTNQAAQSQKQARSLKFCGYREADLRLCFRLCILLVFPWCGSYSGVMAKNPFLHSSR